MVPLYVLWNAPGECEYFLRTVRHLLYSENDFHLSFEKVVGFALQRYAIGLRRLALLFYRIKSKTKTLALCVSYTHFVRVLIGSRFSVSFAIG